MKLELARAKLTKASTLGKLYVDGAQVCWTLEDKLRPRGKKVHGETAIPAGAYRILLRKEGGFHVRYLKRFPGIHKGMLHLQNVPDFTYILIHCGNTVKDSHGCVLTGTRFQLVEEDYTIFDSVKAYLDLYQKVLPALERGEEVWITIHDPK